MTLACTVDSTGISAPAYADVLASLQASYQAIYGSDVYLGNDSQDGQLLAVFAQAISDCNSVAIAVYNAFSPATAQGENLSSVIKINGLVRAVPTHSTCDVLIGGPVGTPIQQNSYVLDPANNRWFLNGAVTIPSSGLVTVTTTAEFAGALQAAPGTLTTIGTPTFGWQTVTNPAAATVGAPVESDGQARTRQAASTALPSNTVLEGLIGALLALPGVARVRAYENLTGATDANGVPSHTLALVVDGGDATAVAQTIARRKNPGAPLAGTTSLAVVDAYGNSTTIAFYRPTVVRVVATIALTALPGYASADGVNVAAAVAAYISAQPIGGKVYLTRVYAAAAGAGVNFNVTSATLGRFGGTLTSTDLAIAFTEAASCAASDVTVTVS